MDFDTLSHRVIGLAIEVHRELGPGLLESAYQRCLVHELSCNGIPHCVEVPLPVLYKGTNIECGYRIDVLVDGTLVVELKNVDKLLPIHEAQLLTYMRLAEAPIGLLINFNSIRLKDGLKRMVL